MIELKRVTKYYGNIKALDNVSLKIPKGQCVALLGPNGAGKSTMIRCMLGLMDFEGEISINGIDVRSFPKKVRSFISYVPQEPRFYNMKAIEILKFYSSIRRVDYKEIDRVVSSVGLEAHLYKYASELSGGMRQRLSFAISLLPNCPVMILDEPTSNLDKKSREDLLELTKELSQRRKTIIFSSHRWDEVYYIAQRIVFLDDGRLEKDFVISNSSENAFGADMTLVIRMKQSDVLRVLEILSREGFMVTKENDCELSLKVRSLKDVFFLMELMERSGIESRL